MRLTIKAVVVAASLAGFPALARAQADSLRPGTLYGTVYDSVGKRPASGAIVQAVPKDSPFGKVLNATADAKGKYELPDVAPGTWIIGFQHAALDSVGIQSPLRAVDVKSGERTRADLAVPSPRRIIAAYCNVSPSDSVGAVLGTMHDASLRRLADSGTVVARWTEITIGVGGINTVQRSVAGTVTRDGAFVLCGVPLGSDAYVIGVRGADSTGAMQIAIPESGLLRIDLHVGGRARVRGLVSSDKGPIAGAQVGVAGTERVVSTDSAGAFRMSEVHAGTQMVEVRALGYVPERLTLSLEADRDTTLNVRLTSFRKMMDTIHVVAQRVYWADRGGFTARKRSGFGYYFDEEEIKRRRPMDLLDLLRRVPSLRVTGGMNRRLLMSGGPRGSCEPALYVDRMRLSSAMLIDVGWLVRIDEVAGVEVYRGSTVPAEFQNPGGCGSIVIWTRPPPPRAR